MWQGMRGSNGNQINMKSNFSNMNGNQINTKGNFSNI